MLCRRNMAVTHTPSLSLTLSTRFSAMAPRIIERAVGSLLEFVIHSVESWRDRRLDIAR